MVDFLKSRGRLYISQALLASVAILLLTGLAIWTDRQESRQRAEESVRSTARILAHQVESDLDDIDALLKTVAQRNQDRHLKSAQEQDRLDEQIRRELPNYRLALRVSVADATGAQTFNSGLPKDDGRPLPNIADRQFFQRARDGETGTLFEGPVLARLDQTWSILMARRIAGRGGDFQGVAVAVVPVEELGAGFKKVGLGTKGIVNLRMADLAQVVRHPALQGKDQGVGNRNVSKTIQDLMRNRPGQAEYLYRTVAPIDGTERMYIYQKFDHSPFWMTVGRATEDFEGGWKHRAMLLSPLSALLVGLLLWGARRLDRQRLVLDETVSQRTQALAKSEELYRELSRENEIIVDSMPDGLMVTDRDGVILRCNHGLLTMFGYTESEVLGQKIEFLMPARFRAERSPVMKSSKTSGFTARHRNGSEFPVDLAFNMIGAGDATQVIYTISDITEHRQAEQALLQAKQAAEQAKEKAEQANAVKSQFLAIMSHEIRTPLNAIIGMGYTLSRTPLDTDQRQQLATMEAASRQLLGQLNDILDMAKIEAGEIIIESTHFTLQALVMDIAIMFVPEVRTKGLEFVLAADWQSVPAVLVGDPQKIRQLLTNLLGNAVKFTQQGQIRLGIQAAQCNESQAILHFEVTDTGIGIPAEALPGLFKPFAQADGSTSRRFGGTGLGLALTKQLAECMGGIVGAESQPGQGSRFWFELPLQISVADDDPATRAVQQGSLPVDEFQPDNQQCLLLPGVKVLLVDDSRMNLDVCQRLLESEGATATLCESGAAALEQLATGSTDFDAVLMDVQMPGMDGCETTRRIRARQLKLPVIALTAGATATERDMTVAAGMDDFLTKPIDPLQLTRTLRRHVEAFRGESLPLMPRAPVADIGAAAEQDWPELPGLRVAEVRERLADDRALFIRLLGRFLNESVELLTQTQQAVRQGDAATAAARLHSLRGQTSNMGAMEVANLAGQLERQAKDGSLAPQELAPLEAELQLLNQGLAAWLQDRRPAPATNTTPAAPAELDLAQLEALRQLLKRQMARARPAYDALKPALAQQLDGPTMARLELAMDSLDFKSALALIAALDGTGT